MKVSSLIFVSVIATLSLLQNAHAQVDSVRLLSEIVVQGFSANRSISKVAGSVERLSADQLMRFGNTSFVSAVNTLAGVRMEERSPGSYRFSIRGSLLRSPFGVRNVKFYWNGLPLTDGGGNTYLNLLDFNSLGSIEILKGPSASLYGAGTGGVVLLNPATEDDDLSFSIQLGSFGLFRSHLKAVLLSSSKNSVTASTSFQKSDGFREHTAMERFTTHVDWSYTHSERTKLNTSYLSSKLFYQTPGGLTKTQFKEDSRQARPAAGPNPGAVSQEAAINNTTHYLSSFLEHNIMTNLTFEGGVFASFTDFKNPSIRNYEIRQERNIGSRVELKYCANLGTVKSNFSAGGEYHYFNSSIRNNSNLSGTQGPLQFQDRLYSSSGLLFTQADIEFTKQFFLTLGGSLNFLRYTFNRLYPLPVIEQERNFEPSFFPRLALLKKFSESLSIHASASQGFSPPSLAEVRPSTNAYNNNLKAEQGTNFEIGFRGKAFTKKLSYDVTIYTFQLDKTIVIQREMDGAEYFVNAGETSQQGLEATVSATLLKNKNILFVSWISYTRSDYSFSNYINDGVDYSGNRLTGVAPTIACLGMDVNLKRGYYANTTLYYSDRTPLNDANAEFAPAYWLLGARIGFKNNIGKRFFDFFAGIDNALNEKYSLGNDLNALGGRFYNTAPARNYFLGLTLRFNRVNK